MNKENKWGDEDLNLGLNLKRNIAAGVIGLSLVIGIYASLSGAPSANDARLLLIKQDYSESLNVIDSIVGDFDLQDQHAEAFKIKSEIHLDKDSGFYNLRDGLATLENLFSETKSIHTARNIIRVGQKLNYSDKKVLKYLTFLAKKDDIDAISRLANFYFQKEDNQYRLKSVKYFKMLPESTDSNISLAKLEMLSGMLTTANVSRAEVFLNSAISMGSSEAALELAYLQLEKAKLEPLSGQIYKSKFPIMVKRAIDMGYRGEKLKQTAAIIRVGRFGVPQDQTLSSLLMKIYSDTKQNSKKNEV